MYLYLLIAGANDGAQLFDFLSGFVLRITLSTKTHCLPRFPAFLL